MVPGNTQLPPCCCIVMEQNRLPQSSMLLLLLIGPILITMPLFLNTTGSHCNVPLAAWFCFKYSHGDMHWCDHHYEHILEQGCPELPGSKRLLQNVLSQRCPRQRLWVIHC